MGNNSNSNNNNNTNNYHNNNNYRGNNNNHRNNYEPSEAQKMQWELKKENPLAKGNARSEGEASKNVILPSRALTVLELSSVVRVQKEKLVRMLRDLGERPPRGSALDDYKIDVDVAELVALELGLDPIREKRGKCSMEAAESRMRRQAAQEDGDGVGVVAVEDELYETYPARPPVVCIMGHVDHGKTTLMDRLRQKAAEATGGGGVPKQKTKSKKGSKTKGKVPKGGDGVNNVAGTEAGGITQVVSAFQVQLPGTGEGGANIDAVTFLDTPGHAAFKAMRQSGSNGADVVVLVVAADDGVSPQTIEIIDMYKGIARSQPGSISMMVAMTKIDKPGIDIEESIMRIENQLMEHDIFSERLALRDCEFGGVQIVPVSGLTGDGLDELIEGLVLQSEVMDLRACRESRAEGLIIDARVSEIVMYFFLCAYQYILHVVLLLFQIEQGLGVVADCIIRWGKLEPVRQPCSRHLLMFLVFKCCNINDYQPCIVFIQ